METWMNQTWWLYDLTVIAIVTLCIWGGWRRGLIRTAAGLLGYGAALLLSGVLAQPAAELVYNRWLAEPCAAILEQKMEQYHLADSIQQTLNAYGVQLDDASLQQIADHPDSATDQLYTVVSQKTIADVYRAARLDERGDFAQTGFAGTAKPCGAVGGIGAVR